MLDFGDMVFKINTSQEIYFLETACKKLIEMDKEEPLHVDVINKTIGNIVLR